MQLPLQRMHLLREALRRQAVAGAVESATHGVDPPRIDPRPRPGSAPSAPSASRTSKCARTPVGGQRSGIPGGRCARARSVRPPGRRPATSCATVRLTPRCSARRVSDRRNRPKKSEAAHLALDYWARPAPTGGGGPMPRSVPPAPPGSRAPAPLRRRPGQRRDIPRRGSFFGQPVGGQPVERHGRRRPADPGTPPPPRSPGAGCPAGSSLPRSAAPARRRRPNRRAGRRRRPPGPADDGRNTC